MNTIWPETRAKFLFKQLRRPCLETDGTVTAFRDGEVMLRSERRESGFTEAVQYHGYQGVLIGDLVIHSMDGFAGAIGVSKSNGRMSPVAHIYRPRMDLDLPFYAYYLRHLANVGYIQSLAKGIRERSTSFDPSTFAEVPLPVPPLAEQQRISRYLDNQLATLTKLISAKKKQIAQINEYRTEETERLVFSPDVLCTPSYIKNSSELADPFAITLPDTWTRNKFRYIASNASRASGGKGDLLSVYLNEGVIPFSQGGEDRVHNPSEDMAKYQIVKPGYLVMNNQQAWRGSVGVSAYQGIISPAYHIYKLSNDFLPEFANLLFRSRPMVFLYEQVSRGVGNIQRNLDGSSLKNIPVVYPSIQAQFTSVEEVARISNSCASTIEVLDQSISRLEELKKSILTHVITGVLDVRAGKDFL